MQLGRRITAWEAVCVPSMTTLDIINLDFNMSGGVARLGVVPLLPGWPGNLKLSLHSLRCLHFLQTGGGGGRLLFREDRCSGEDMSSRKNCECSSSESRMAELLSELVTSSGRVGKVIGKKAASSIFLNP